MKMSTDDIISGFFRDKILISSENRRRALKINEYTGNANEFGLRYTGVCDFTGGFLFFFCLFDFYSSINVDLGYSFYILAALCDVCDRKCYSTMNYILWF